MPFLGTETWPGQVTWAIIFTGSRNQGHPAICHYCASPKSSFVSSLALPIMGRPMCQLAAGLWPSPVARASLPQPQSRLFKMLNPFDISRTRPLIESYDPPLAPGIPLNPTWCHLLTRTLILLIAVRNEQYWCVY